MGCLGNSKTEDQRIDEKAQREANKKIEKQLQKERLAYKATHRLLLLGKEEKERRGPRLGDGGEEGEERGAHLPPPPQPPHFSPPGRRGAAQRPGGERDVVVCAFRDDKCRACGIER